MALPLVRTRILVGQAIGVRVDLLAGHDVLAVSGVELEEGFVRDLLFRA